MSTPNGRRQVEVASRVFDFDWSADGSRLVFERTNEIWVATIGNTGVRLRRLTRSGPGQVAHGPRWSPDGRLILFDRGDYGPDGLWLMRPDGGDARRIADGEIFEREWSPDGTRIAYEVSDGLFVAGPEGSDRRLVADFGGVWDWSPDGRRIAIGGELRGLSPDPYPIVVIDIDEHHATRVTQRR